jgi:negative regulator of flagellin synthesis FlgM
VELTDEARQLLRLEEKLAQFPAVDSQRVEAIRQAIADGSYRIDADLIAERLLATEQQQKNGER